MVWVCVAHLEYIVAHIDHSLTPSPCPCALLTISPPPLPQPPASAYTPALNLDHVATASGEG